jgi:2-polyprenyl-6-hydroxyphenyl methylase/3-demethylubiquinone-9 3-methyltransferase
MNDLEQYEINAREWWADNGRFRPLFYLNVPRFEYFDDLIPLWKNKKILDVGCGGGYTCEFLSPRGAEVHGVDLSKASIQAAEQHARENNLNINYQQANACQLPYPDATFDKVLCVDVLEHLEKWELPLAIAEIKRVLKPGGHFLFDTINRNWFTRFFVVWLMEKILRMIPINTHAARLFIRPNELRIILESNGLKVIDIKGMCPWGFDLSSRAPKFKIIPWTFAFYLGVAKK